MPDDDWIAAEREHERDAARAELRATTRDVAGLTARLADVRAEADSDATSDLLGVLRAKVAALPVPIRLSEDPSDALVWRREVLALLDEAGPDKKSLLSDYDPVPGLVARGVMSDEHDPVSCEMDCCRLGGPQ